MVNSWVRQQSRLFAPRDLELRRSLNFISLLRSSDDDLPVLHARSSLGYFKCYEGWLCWRRISSPNHDAQAGWPLYAVDRFSVKLSQS
jgi:hypothetical protein